MSSSKGISHFPVWVDDSIRMVTIPGEHPTVTGARFNLWVASATGELGPVGVLPDDDATLQPTSRLPPEEWAALKPQIVRSWEKGDGIWLIHRLLKEREKQERKAKKASRSGRLGGLARAGREAQDEQTPSERQAGEVANAKRTLCQNPSDRLANAKQTPDQNPSDRLANAKQTPGPNPSDRQANAKRTLSSLSSPLLSGEDIKKSCLTPESLSRNEGQPADPPDQDQDSSFRSANQDQEPGPDEAQAPGPTDTRPPSYTDEQLAQLDVLRQRIRASPPLRPQADAIDRVLQKHLAEGIPFQVAERGLAAILEHQPRLAAAYLSRVLRVEGPTEHVAAHAARHRAMEHVGSDGLVKALTARGAADEG